VTIVINRYLSHASHCIYLQGVLLSKKKITYSIFGNNLGKLMIMSNTKLI